MTTAADDSAVEEAFEAYLAGRPVPAEGADLAAFAGAVRTTAIQPGRPNAALAELLATGLLVDQPPLSVRTAKRRRRPMWFFTAVFAKIASAGAIAQAATGAGIVLVGFTGVGAAGALPTPVQHGFATVVAAISPMAGSDDGSDIQPVTDPTVSSSSSAASSSADATTADSTATGSTATGSTATDSTDAPASSTPKNFGQRVSEQAHNGGVSGKDVSSWAHERNAARKSGTATSTDSPEADETEKASASESEAPESSDGESSGNSGSGSRHGHR
jgi:hypothetical protein